MSMKGWTQGTQASARLIVPPQWLDQRLQPCFMRTESPTTGLAARQYSPIPEDDIEGA
jgi:hypothetical protein